MLINSYKQKLIETLSFKFISETAMAVLGENNHKFCIIIIFMIHTNI